jgi:tyrosinase
VSHSEQKENAMTNGLRTRQNVAGMTSDHPTLVAYRTAVKEMRNLPESNPRNWRRQARIHENNCPHGNWYFLPWHRKYILDFEQICRDLSGDSDFALPYWNWTSTRHIPAPFWEGTLDSNRRIGRREEIPGRFVGRRVIDRVLRQNDFELFGSTRPRNPRQTNTDPRWQQAPGAKALLEATPHDMVHVRVGGNMGDVPTSPLDPIFWLHHCNIDRLWAEWNGRGHGNTSNALWRNFTLRPFNTLVRDLQNITQLGYTYSGLAQTRLAEASESPPLLERAKERFELIEPQVASLGQEVRFPVEVPQSPLPLAAEARFVEDVAENGGPKVLAFVRGVEPPEDNQVTVNVFLNCPYLTAETPASDPHYVGDFTFFGAHEHDEEVDHDMKQSFVFELTDTVDRLRALESGLESQLTVQLMAVPLEGRDVPPQEIGIEGVEIVYI